MLKIMVPEGIDKPVVHNQTNSHKTAGIAIKMGKYFAELIHLPMIVGAAKLL